jgi:hypothetical protein
MSLFTSKLHSLHLEDGRSNPEDFDLKLLGIICATESEVSSPYTVYLARVANCLVLDLSVQKLRCCRRSDFVGEILKFNTLQICLADHIT